MATQLFILAPGGSRPERCPRGHQPPRAAWSTANAGATPPPPPPARPISSVINEDIVINEIFYHALNDGPEQWIELYNKGAAAVDLSGWKFSGRGRFWLSRPATSIARRRLPRRGLESHRLRHAPSHRHRPGTMERQLSGRGGEPSPCAMPMTTSPTKSRYFDGGRWSQWADGGGSSLELTRCPRRQRPRGTWAASDESCPAAWQNYQLHRHRAHTTAGSDPTYWNEFVFGLLDTGEFLIDDISLKVVRRKPRH